MRWGYFVIALFIAQAAAPQALAIKEPLKWADVQCCGTDISVGKDGSVWLIGTDGKIYRYSGSTWDGRRGGRGKRIAVAPDGNPWITAKDTSVWRYDGRKWRRVPGLAHDIGIGADGTVWVLGVNNVAGGHGIFRRDGNKWTAIPGGAVRIAVDPDGNAWVVNNTGLIYRFNGKAFERLPGAEARDIGIGADGTVWLVAGRNGSVFKWTGKTWQQHDGRLVAISAGPNGRPWGVASNNRIYAAADSFNAIQQAERAKRWLASLVEFKAKFPGIFPDWNLFDFNFGVKDAEGTGKVWGHDVTLTLYTPKGKKSPNLAISINKADGNDLMRAMKQPQLLPFALKNLSLVFVLPKNGQKRAQAKDLPKGLQNRVKNVARTFDLAPGMNILTQLDASKLPAANSLLGLIGLRKVDDLTITGQISKLAIKKHKPWRDPFGLKDVNVNAATMLIVTTRPGSFVGTVEGWLAPKHPYYRNVSIWGNTKFKGKSYLLYAQRAVLKASAGAKPATVGTAYGFDAKTVTLKDMVELAKMLPTTKHFPLSFANGLPLEKIALHNPKNVRYNAAGYDPPVFSDMIFVSASTKVVIPDGRPLPGTDGIDGTPGPLLYANGELKLDGKALGNADISISGKGIHGDASTKKASINVGKLLGRSAKLSGQAAFKIDIDDKQQRMMLETAINIAGWVKRDATISFTPNKTKLNFDMGCAPPLKVDATLSSPKQPWKGISDVLKGLRVDPKQSFTCGGKAFQFVRGVFTDAGSQIAGGAKVTAQAIASATNYTVGKIAGGAKKMAGEIKKVFGRGGSSRHRPSNRTRDTCGKSPDHRWVPEFKQCWEIGHKYLYMVKNTRGEGFCLQVDRARNDNGTDAEFGNCDMNWTQQWKFDNGKIVNAEGKCLDADKNAALGAKLQIWTCHGRSNQQWKVHQGRLANVNGYCVGGRVGHDQKLKIVPCGSMLGVIGWAAVAAPFDKTPWAGGAIFQIRSKAFGTCLDIAHRDRRLKTWTCNSKNINQHFRAEGPYGDGPYWMKIKSVKYNRCYRFGWDVRQKDLPCAHDSNNREVWQLFWQTDGSFCIHNLDQRNKRRPNIAMEIPRKGHDQLLVLRGNKCNWNQRFYLDRVN